MCTYLKSSSYAWAIVVLLLLASCGQGDSGFTILESGAKYKVLSLGDDEYVPAVGQYISFTLSIFNVEETLLYQTKKLGVDKNEYIYFTHKKQGAISRGMQQFHEGDSILFVLSEALFIEQFPNIKDLSPSQEYQVAMKINHVEDREERNNRLESLRNHARVREALILDDYLEGEGDKYVPWQGLYLNVIKDGYKKVSLNDNIILSYKAYTLDGKLFDETTSESSIKYSYGESAQVIDGLTMVISRLGIGSVAAVIIPSEFAFGEAGAVKELIPPFTPLRYELTVTEDESVMKY